MSVNMEVGGSETGFIGRGVASCLILLPSVTFFGRVSLLGNLYVLVWSLLVLY